VLSNISCSVRFSFYYVNTCTNTSLWKSMPKLRNIYISGVVIIQVIVQSLLNYRLIGSLSIRQFAVSVRFVCCSIEIVYLQSQNKSTEILKENILILLIHLTSPVNTFYLKLIVYWFMKFFPKHLLLSHIS